MKQKAKKELLKDLKKLMMDDTFGDMGDSLKSKKMQKVTVASPSEEGLEEGLSKAQQILQKRDAMMGDEEESEDEEGDEFDCGGKKDEYAEGGLGDYDVPDEDTPETEKPSERFIEEKGYNDKKTGPYRADPEDHKREYEDGGLPEDEIPIMEEEEPQVFDGDLRLEELMESLPEELKMQLLEALSKKNDPEAALE